MKTQEYINIFKEVMSQILDKDVALEILRQEGLDQRTNSINESKKSVDNKLTPKQESFLKSLGYEGDTSNLTKEEAKILIKKLLEEKGGDY